MASYIVTCFFTFIAIPIPFSNLKYIFYFYLAMYVLQHTDNLSKTMKHDDVSTAEGQDVLVMIITTYLEVSQ